MGRRGRKRKIKYRLKRGTVFSVLSTLSFIFAGLVMISFAQKGELLIFLNDLLIKFFGWGTIILPFVAIISGSMFARFSGKLARMNVFIGALLLLFSLIGLSRSGIIGLQIWQGIAGLITSVGAFIVLLGSVFIGITVLFETSFEDIVFFFKSLISFLKKNLSSSRKLMQIQVTNNKNIESSMETKGKNKMRDNKSKNEKDFSLPSSTISSLSNVQQKVWQYPPLDILTDVIGSEADRGDVKRNANVIEKTLESFGIQAKVAEVNGGPAVTQYALEISLGTKLSKITALSNDLALALAAPTGQIRIEAPIPGRSLVGIEVPNHSLEVVTLKRMLASSEMKKTKSKLAIGLGLDVSGKPVVADLAKMPHILVAGATGSGKSVSINNFITTVLFRTSPSEVKLILVDPKRVELTQYNGIPHLLTPVIVEPEKVVSALKWTIAEMERRYKMFAEAGARNIESYNEISGIQLLPYLVIIIDELADVILYSPSEVEDTITRLAQMARATGIHLVLSTQRPSVDVITGLIKANIPARIAFNVSSMIDSRVIIDAPGAEKLLGRGDMLYIPPEQAKPSRIQGAYVSDGEIKAVIDFLKQTGIEPQYTEEVTNKYHANKVASGTLQTEETDEFFDEAIKIVCQNKKASASLLQRKLSIGYARAARILDQLESAGIVGPSEGSKPRDVLISNASEVLRSEEENPSATEQ